MLFVDFCEEKSINLIKCCKTASMYEFMYQFVCVWHIHMWRFRSKSILLPHSHCSMLLSTSEYWRFCILNSKQLWMGYALCDFSYTKTHANKSITFSREISLLKLSAPNRHRNSEHTVHVWIINFQNEIMNKQRGERKNNSRDQKSKLCLAFDSNGAEPKTYHTMKHEQIISMSAKTMKLWHTCASYFTFYT